MALTNWKRCPSNHPDEDVRQVFTYLTHQLLFFSGICLTLSVSQCPSSDRNQGSALNENNFDPERLPYPSNRLNTRTHSVKKLRPIALIAHERQRAPRSISGEQFTWRGKSTVMMVAMATSRRSSEKFDCVNRMAFLKTIKIGYFWKATPDGVVLSTPQWRTLDVLCCKHDFRKNTLQLKTLQRFLFFSWAGFFFFVCLGLNHFATGRRKRVQLS